MRALHALLGVAMAAIAACESETSHVGLDEPIVVHDAELKRGALPSRDDGPSITSLQLNFGVLTPGAPRLSVSGRASRESFAVAIRLKELGSGYWLKPVGAADPALPDELTFDFSLQAATELDPGQHTFEAVAFDGKGRPGPIYTIPVCIASALPDNGNACDPESAPPPAVISLTWHADVDLDLTVEAPDGKRYDRSTRFALNEDGSQRFGLVFDGSSGCLADGRRREDFVLYDKPQAGSTWLVYANLFDACGHTAAPFELTIYRAKKGADGSVRLQPDAPIRGEFLRAQQNGGAGAPLFLKAVQF